MEISEFWQGVIAGLGGLGWFLIITLLIAVFVFRKRGQ